MLGIRDAEACVAFWRIQADCTPIDGAPMGVKSFAVAIAALAATMFATSCSGGTVDFANESNSAIVIVQIGAAGESVYSEINATGGMSVHMRWFDGCIDDDLEARLGDGTFIAARPGPFCVDDPAWVITQQDVEQARSAGE